jgi:hypothetical protein
MQKDNLEIVLENILGKFDLVLEGHEALRKEIRDTREDLIERISLVDFKVDALSHRVDEVDIRLSKKIDEVDARLGQKIDAVAADLRAHREDTEAHPKIYRVGEQ